MGILYDTATVDADGNVYPTIGENIRHGVRGDETGTEHAVINLQLSGESWSCSVLENSGNVNLTANCSATGLYLNAPSDDIVNIIDAKVSAVTTCTGGNFVLHGQAVYAETNNLFVSYDSTGITALNVNLRVVYKVGEY